MNIFRHGDILLRPTTEVKGDKVKSNKSFILARGEATNHTHKITVPNVDDMEVFQTPEGGYYMRLKEVGTLTHEEHGTLTIPVGDYIIEREQEMDWFSMVKRQVID